jgi:hypothetical protein
MELDYALHSAVDTLITPDFRMQLISPGTFHFAISVAPSGDTCVHSLPGNDAALFIAEMMGADSYQLSPGKSVMFRAGKISGAAEAPAECGCPELKSLTVAPDAVTLPPELLSAPAAEANGTRGANSGPAHLEVNGSFVYRGNEAVQDYYSSVARLSLSTDNSKLALALLPQVKGPVRGPDVEARSVKKKEGALHRFGSFFGHLFGK